MLSVMRYANAGPKRRDAMAMAAAPYLHPKLSTVEAKQTEPETPEAPHIQVTFVVREGVFRQLRSLLEV